MEGKKRDWTVETWAVGVGCRYYPASSITTFSERCWNLRGKEERNPKEKGRSVREIELMALEMQLKIGLGREVTS